MTTVDATAIHPLTHDEAMALQERELDRALALLRALEPGEWSAPTDCPEWDVRRMYLHVLGACEAAARVRENVKQLARGVARRRREGGALEAALSAVQVDERDHLDPAQVVDRLAAVAPAAIRGRRRIPRVARERVKIPIDAPVREPWSLGYLVDTIYLRDLWMHRVDAARATGRALELTADHDGRIVADIVAEWARRHHLPFVLDLDGPAGGSFAHEGDAADAEHRRMDAVEFCRTLAGRNPAAATGLLTTVVPF